MALGIINISRAIFEGIQTAIGVYILTKFAKKNTINTYFGKIVKGFKQ